MLVYDTLNNLIHYPELLYEIDMKYNHVETQGT